MLSFQRRIRRVFVLVISALALSSAFSCSGEAPVKEQQESPASGAATRAQAMAETIRSLYDRLTLYSQAQAGAKSSARLEFKLDHFQVLEQSDFSSLHWNELVTLPAGAVIDVTRELETAASGVKGVRYNARWNDVPERGASLPDGVSPDEVTVEEALKRASESNAELGEVHAITSFDVEVRFEGRSRHYRAAVLWKQSPFDTPVSREDAEVAFFAVDNITQGVHEVGVEPEIAAAHVALAPAPTPAAAPANAPLGSERGTKDACTPSTRVYPEIPQEQRKGKYWARAEFRGECSCDSACVARCSSSIVAKTCKYDHWSSVCRKMDESTEIMSALNEIGPVKCAAGLACAGKGCFLCLCFSTSIKATIKITKISAMELKVDFTFEGATWKAGLKAEWTCADCRTLGPVTTSMRRDRHTSEGFSEGIDESVCGDALCDGPENCSNCSRDCGSCGPVCGNGACEAGETCSTCPADCGTCGPVCGNGVCQPGENCSSCPTDCGPCGPVCGNGTCQPGENCSNCPTDCGPCGPVCGDGVCAPGQEDCGTCLTDCPCWNPNYPICQNHQCVSGVVCGNGVCQPGENCGNCSVDCGPCGPVCGDGVCAPGQEDCGNCLNDCPCWNPNYPVCQNHQCVASVVCGDGVCAPGEEDCGSCLSDCPCWNPDYPVCQNGQCVAAIECGNGVCEAGEECWNCEMDCGYCSP